MINPHINVDKARKAVDVINWGSAPIVERKGIFYPHGFEVKTLHLGTLFTAKSLIESGEVRFQFCHNQVEGELCKSPTAALNSIAEKIELEGYRGGTNGKLHFGAASLDAQNKIKLYHNLPGAVAIARVKMTKKRTRREDALDFCMIASNTRVKVELEEVANHCLEEDWADDLSVLDKRIERAGPSFIKLMEDMRSKIAREK